MERLEQVVGEEFFCDERLIIVAPSDVVEILTILNLNPNPHPIFNFFSGWLNGPKNKID